MAARPNSGKRAGPNWRRLATRELVIIVILPTVMLAMSSGVLALAVESWKGAPSDHFKEMQAFVEANPMYFTQQELSTFLTDNTLPESSFSQRVVSHAIERLTAQCINSGIVLGLAIVVDVGYLVYSWLSDTKQRSKSADGPLNSFPKTRISSLQDVAKSILTADGVFVAVAVGAASLRLGFGLYQLFGLTLLFLSLVLGFAVMSEIFTGVTEEATTEVTIQEGKVINALYLAHWQLWYFIMGGLVIVRGLF